METGHCLEYFAVSLSIEFATRVLSEAQLRLKCYANPMTIAIHHIGIAPNYLDAHRPED